MVPHQLVSRLGGKRTSRMIQSGLIPSKDKVPRFRCINGGGSLVFVLSLSGPWLTI